MARFWLNLGWEWLPFCPPLATDESPLWLGLQNTQKFLKKNTDWYPTQPACKLQTTTTMSELCVLTYLGTYSYIVFSLLLLCKTYNWLGTCHFSWCCNNYACNAMQYRVEHWPLLITVYLQLIFGKSCWNNYFFFPLFGKKKKEKKRKEKRKNRRIWQS